MLSKGLVYLSLVKLFKFNFLKILFTIDGKKEYEIDRWIDLAAILLQALNRRWNGMGLTIYKLILAYGY